MIVVLITLYSVTVIRNQYSHSKTQPFQCTCFICNKAKSKSYKTNKNFDKFYRFSNDIYFSWNKPYIFLIATEHVEYEIGSPTFNQKIQ